MTSFTLVLALVSGLFQPDRVQNTTTQTTAANLKVVGYYADWTAERYPLADIPADKLTHVNYAFGKIDPDNRLTWNASAASIAYIPATAANRTARTDCSIRSRC